LDGWDGAVNQSQLTKLTRIKPASLAGEALAGFSLVAEKPPRAG